MSDQTLIAINGVYYKKSRSSTKSGNRCVAVAFLDGKVSVVNTNSADISLEFTLDEWSAFLDGAKRGEFDLLQLTQR
jgi:hypothetical protein